MRLFGISIERLRMIFESRLISHHFFRYLYFYCMLLWFNTGAISVRVHLSKLCAKEKDLRSVINTE